MRAARPAGVLDVVPAARTVLLMAVPGTDLAALRRAVLDLPVDPAAAPEGETVEIPVTYDGPDLAEVARLTGMDEDGVVAAHTGTPWRTNGQVPAVELRRHWPVPRSSTRSADAALEHGQLTARGYGRVLRLAWTLADLQETIEADNLVVSMAHNMAVPQKFRAAMLEVITEFVNDPGLSPEDAAVRLSDAVANEL